MFKKKTHKTNFLTGISKATSIHFLCKANAFPQVLSSQQDPSYACVDVGVGIVGLRASDEGVLDREIQFIYFLHATRSFLQGVNCLWGLSIHLASGFLT